MCLAFRQHVYLEATLAQEFRGQKLNRTHDSDGMGMPAGQGLVTCSIKSRTETAFAMNNMVLCLCSCTEVQHVKNSLHLSQNIYQNDPDHSYCIPIIYYNI